MNETKAVSELRSFKSKGIIDWKSEAVSLDEQLIKQAAELRQIVKEFKTIQGEIGSGRSAFAVMDMLRSTTNKLQQIAIQR